MNTFTAVIYRLPDAPIESFKETLRLLQQKLDDMTTGNRTPDLYIMGDFNLPTVDWEFPDHSQCQSLVEQQAARDLLDFMNKNFLAQVVLKPTRGRNTIDLVLTNKSQDIIETNVTETQMSDHKLVQLTLGYNPLMPKSQPLEVLDEYSFRAVDIHRADFDTMNNQLATTDWLALKQLCHDDDDGSKFLDLIILTVLQITLLNSPKKPVQETGVRSSPKNRQSRDKYILKRRRRKLNARIRALKERNPMSPTIANLTRDVSLLTYEISQLIIQQLDEKEAKVVDTIKSNPRYFYSYAKRFAKTKSSVAPIKDNNGTLNTDPVVKAELLQEQYTKVFSNPNAANVGDSLDGLQPAPKKIWIQSPSALKIFWKPSRNLILTLQPRMAISLLKF